MKWCVSKYFLGLVHHNPRIPKSTHEFPNKQKEHRHASYQKKDDFKLKIIMEILSDPFKTFQIILSPLEHLWRGSARQWTSSMRLVALSGDLRWSPVTLWLKLRGRFFQQTSRSRGIFLFPIYYLYGIFFASKNLGKISWGESFFFFK